MNLLNPSCSGVMMPFVSMYHCKRWLTLHGLQYTACETDGAVALGLQLDHSYLQNWDHPGFLPALRYLSFRSRLDCKRQRVCFRLWCHCWCWMTVSCHWDSSSWWCVYCCCVHMLVARCFLVAVCYHDWLQFQYELCKQDGIICGKRCKVIGQYNKVTVYCLLYKEFP